MKRISTALLFAALLTTGCASLGRVHALIGDKVVQDATNALAIAEQSGNVAMQQCATTTLEVAAKAPKPEQVVGVLSGIAAAQAKEALLAIIRRDCGEIYLDTRGALIRIGLFGMF